MEPFFQFVLSGTLYRGFMDSQAVESIRGFADTTIVVLRTLIRGFADTPHHEKLYISST
jgi:hypothetical protein